MTRASELEGVLRELSPQVLSALVRRYGGFDACEDAVQEALLAASLQWPAEGLPDNPKAWLITTASRRRIELWRNESARLRREEAAASLAALTPGTSPAVDDTLTLLLLCCHPELTTVSQVALTLRAVGGLTTAEIARAFEREVAAAAFSHGPARRSVGAWAGCAVCDVCRCGTGLSVAWRSRHGTLWTIFGAIGDSATPVVEGDKLSPPVRPGRRACRPVRPPRGGSWPGRGRAARAAPCGRTG